MSSSGGPSSAGNYPPDPPSTSLESLRTRAPPSTNHASAHHAPVNVARTPWLPPSTSANDGDRRDFVPPPPPLPAEEGLGVSRRRKGPRHTIIHLNNSASLVGVHAPITNRQHGVEATVSRTSTPAPNVSPRPVGIDEESIADVPPKSHNDTDAVANAGTTGPLNDRITALARRAGFVSPSFLLVWLGVMLCLGCGLLLAPTRRHSVPNGLEHCSPRLRNDSSDSDAATRLSDTSSWHEFKQLVIMSEEQLCPHSTSDPITIDKAAINGSSATKLDSMQIIEEALHKVINTTTTLGMITDSSSLLHHGNGWLDLHRDLLELVHDMLSNSTAHLWNATSAILHTIHTSCPGAVINKTDGTSSPIDRVSLGDIDAGDGCNYRLHACLSFHESMVDPHSDRLLSLTINLIDHYNALTRLLADLLDAAWKRSLQAPSTFWRGNPFRRVRSQSRSATLWDPLFDTVKVLQHYLDYAMPAIIDLDRSRRRSASNHPDRGGSSNYWQSTQSPDHVRRRNLLNHWRHATCTWLGLYSHLLQMTVGSRPKDAAGGSKSECSIGLPCE